MTQFDLEAYGGNRIDWPVVPTRHTPGRVIYDAGRSFRVISADGERVCHAVGGEQTIIGDFVLIDQDNHIRSILPRRGVLQRAAVGRRTRAQVLAAHVDLVLVAMGLDGDYNLRRLERYRVLLNACNLPGVVVLTKADLAPELDEQVTVARRIAGDLPVIATSADTGLGLGELRDLWPAGATATLIGSSGVGKSTLINCLSTASQLATRSVRSGDDRGRHTTTHRQLVVLAGGQLLIDTPGIREVAAWADQDAVDDAFPEIERLASHCRFSDCGHDSEPGCAIAEAAAKGLIDPLRVSSWAQLREESARQAIRRDEAARRHHERSLGKLYKSIQRHQRDRKGRR